MKINFQTLTGRENSYLTEYNGFFFEPETLSHLKKLQELATKELGADIQIISSFRSFERQQMIWNKKASGDRDILDDRNNKVDILSLTKEELLQKIMRFSAIPGLSRHHWGTEIDIYDANTLSKEEVQLIPSEWSKNGPFYKLGKWLEEKISKEQSLGFYNPYREDRGGVHPEKWHLSYKPIAKKFYQSYTEDIFIENLQQADIHLKEQIIENVSNIFNKFFLDVAQ